MSRYLDNNIILDKVVEDNDNYIIRDNILYCKGVSDKVVSSNYLNNYTITVSSMSKKRITYNIISKYAKTDASEVCLDNLNMLYCTNNDIEYKESLFIISKNDSNKWVTTEFSMLG